MGARPATAPPQGGGSTPPTPARRTRCLRCRRGAAGAVASPSTSRCAANACGNCECRPIGNRGAGGSRTQCGSHPWVPPPPPLLAPSLFRTCPHVLLRHHCRRPGGHVISASDRQRQTPLSMWDAARRQRPDRARPPPPRLEEPDHGCTQGRLLPCSLSAQLGRCGHRHCHVPWSGSSGGSRGAPKDPLRTYAN